MDYIKRISEIVESKKELFTFISDEIWGSAELKFEEYTSANLLCKTLEKEGFNVEKNIGGMETAFIGSFGQGKPVIAILGEFDALYGLSQVAGATFQKPIIEGGAGHGCGHHLLGAGALGAAIALKYYLAENNLSGTIRYYGCPGEEGGFGKTFLVRDGVFDGVDCVFTWHPGTKNSVQNSSMLANYNIYYRFKGKSSHAAVAPQLGRSALDALELMNVGVNYLREHIIQEARIHYAITNTGGKSPNVVQAESEEYLSIRTPKTHQIREIYERVCDIAKGAVLMTGTTVDYQLDSAVSSLIPNKTLGKIMYRNYYELGIPVYDNEDYKISEAFSNILSNVAKKSVPKELVGKTLSDILEPFAETEGIEMASTDVGDVSCIVPTAFCWVACAANGTPLHSWEMVAQGKTPIAHKGLLHAAKVIAATAVRILMNPEVLIEAKEELKERLGDEGYICPISMEVKPSKTGKC